MTHSGPFQSLLFCDSVIQMGIVSHDCFRIVQFHIPTCSSFDYLEIDSILAFQENSESTVFIGDLTAVLHEMATTTSVIYTQWLTIPVARSGLQG